MKKKKENEKNEKSLEKVREKRNLSEAIRKFKKTWIVKGTNTLILIAILVAIFVLINFGMKKLDLTPIDCSTSQDYTLTEESKERIKDIDKDIDVYFVGWEEEEVSYKVAKQYNKANPKINVEIIDATTNIEVAKKYDVSNDDHSIIVICGKKYRILTYYDLITYDSNYNTVDISEQKITSAILNVTSDYTPKVYFLTGYTNMDINDNEGLSILAQYLENEVLTYEKLNILTTQEVPDDCDTLIITTPNKDFDKIVADSIIKYIKKGGNILWFNGVSVEDQNFENVNRVLSQYGVNSFEKGLIYETNPSNIVLNSQICFMPTVENTEILKDVNANSGVIFLSATKININTDKLEELNVVETDLLTAQDTTYFTKNLTSGPNQKEDTKGPFVVGTQLVKTIKEATEATEDKEAEEAVTSTLIIYGNDNFISDVTVPDNLGNPYPVIYLANNADVALNSIAYLTNTDQDITIRKSYSDSQTTFTPTQKQISIILFIIFTVPFVIIAIGIIVWIYRNFWKKQLPNEIIIMDEKATIDRLRTIFILCGLIYFVIVIPLGFIMINMEKDSVNGIIQNAILWSILSLIISVVILIIASRRVFYMRKIEKNAISKITKRILIYMIVFYVLPDIFNVVDNIKKSLAFSNKTIIFLVIILVLKYVFLFFIIKKQLNKNIYNNE